MTVVLAHQGGWDEVLYVLGPLAVLVALLRLASKRADAEHEADEHRSAERGAEPDPDDPPGGASWPG